uniref:tRNA(Ile)-lysidine synthase, chloroplastic n=2 Tax=Roya TaxID=43942 RepID=A0A024B4X9_9VIRI|nr:hypothetical protein RF62 [Roya anglica]YP_009256912.1 tRNA(Ile)-lysidine synthetase [Roya obtusa]AHZ11133.1 hypothetical protein RF62 [Roya anglica]ANI25993.1 tRNA(Ile)-lysidine synthetase [Roya obtusa]
MSRLKKNILENKDIYLLRNVNNAIIERHLLKPYEKILIAVSGGQDSVCLLRILYKLNTQWGWTLGIIHCDHRWNIDSQKQANQVAHLAASMEIDYYQTIAIYPITNEVLARDWRYNIIKNVALNNHYKVIITAHTGTDRIETLLFNLIRGTGLRGIQSLSWKRYLKYNQVIQTFFFRQKYQFLNRKIQFTKTIRGVTNQPNIQKLQISRPLLDLTRTEIRYLIEVWKLSSCVDRTNKNLQIQRNRIRHRVLPYLRLYYNPKIDLALARWAEIVQYENIYFERLVRYLLDKLQLSSEKTLSTSFSKLEVKIVSSLPVALQRRMIKKIFDQYTGKNLNFNSIEQIRLMIFS